MVKTVLLIEDNPDDIELSVHAFGKMESSIKLVVLNDGVEATDYLLGRGNYTDKKSCPIPSLILLDLKMPKVNGLEVLQQIRSNARTKFIPVVILTSSSEEQDIINCYKFGANSYIRKPIDFDHFSKSVKAIADYWLFINIVPQINEII